MNRLNAHDYKIKNPKSFWFLMIYAILIPINFLIAWVSRDDYSSWYLPFFGKIMFSFIIYTLVIIFFIPIYFRKKTLSPRFSLFVFVLWILSVIVLHHIISGIRFGA